MSTRAEAPAAVGPPVPVPAAGPPTPPDSAGPLTRLPTAGANPDRLPGPSTVGGKTFLRIRLLVAVLLFAGWIGFLGYAALTKSRAPIVSHIQVAAAPVAVVAEVEANEGKPATQATVVEALAPGGPAAGSRIMVLNLPTTRGFGGPGRYLLLLEPEFFMRDPANPNELPPYTVVGRQRSPGIDGGGPSKPDIYPWTDDVRKQVEALLRQKAQLGGP